MKYSDIEAFWFCLDSPIQIPCEFEPVQFLADQIYSPLTPLWEFKPELIKAYIWFTVGNEDGARFFLHGH